MNIYPVTKVNIEQAIDLVNKIFPYEIREGAKEGGYATALHASLEPEKNQDWWKKYKLKSLKYFVLVDENTKEIMGVTGLYSSTTDPNGTVWLGWFGINPKYRRKGWGEKLLRWSIDKAKNEEYSTLRLYTSTHPSEAAAQNLYEKFGLKIYDEKIDPDDPYKILYREKQI